MPAISSVIRSPAGSHRIPHVPDEALQRNSSCFAGCTYVYLPKLTGFVLANGGDMGKN
jgi:hypothetical protein